MKYSQRYVELNSQFQLGVDMHLKESNIDIRFIKFDSGMQPVISNHDDSHLDENLSFVYPVFMPKEIQKADKAILLLHGLNERNWNKYLTWAEFLCKETGKPVILFPIAFHINRTPQSWFNPRDLQGLLDLRRQRNGVDRMLSFANVSFSERVSEKPYRFYSSGRQSLNDLSQLFGQIKQGIHPLFSENTEIDIFAYSIGAFLAEIILMSNPQNLFSNSKLFLFCGGGVFSSMFGQSRSIMDKVAYEKLYKYYLNDFTKDAKHDLFRDEIFNSFVSMISPEQKPHERKSFFSRLENKFKGISLLRDKVMPYFGVEEAMGEDIAAKRISKLDYSYNYTHENPFPVGKDIDAKEVDDSFNHIFSEAVHFLAF